MIQSKQCHVKSICESKKKENWKNAFKHLMKQAASLWKLSFCWLKHETQRLEILFNSTLYLRSFVSSNEYHVALGVKFWITPKTRKLMRDFYRVFINIATNASKGLLKRCHKWEVYISLCSHLLRFPIFMALTRLSLYMACLLLMTWKWKSLIFRIR